MTEAAAERSAGVEKTQSPGSRAGALARALIGRRWWWTTLLVLAGLALLIRLGIWQLDRLEQRRAANAVLAAQLAETPLLLNALSDPANEPLVDRQVTAQGEFDFSQQVLLKLQNYNGQPGGHLLAPLLLEGQERAILVDRGWLPEAELGRERWGQFDEPGVVEVTGYVRASERQPVAAEGEAEGSRLEWFRVDVEAIGDQLPYELLPYYLLQSPDDAPASGGIATLPARETPTFDLSEGPHLSYALQWFAFALMLGVGYLYFVYRRLDADLPEAGE
jgi:surfeit locus 1 family protein